MKGKNRGGGRVFGWFGMSRRWLWLLALCPVIGAAGTFVVTKAQPPIYRATVVLLVKQTVGSPAAGAQMAATYVQLINQPVVLSRAASETGGISPSGLAQQVQVVEESDTALIDVSVDDVNANRAAELANAVASAFIAELNEQKIADQYPAVVFQPAVPPTTPDHPQPFQSSLVGGALGFAIAIVLIHLFSLLERPTSRTRNATELADLASDDEPGMKHLPGALIRDVSGPARNHEKS